MTILAFEPPLELTKFIWDVADAASRVINIQIERKRMNGNPHMPLITPIQVFSATKYRPAASARRIMVQLLRRHVWHNRNRGYAEGEAEMALAFGGNDPRFENPISFPMIAYILGRDHSEFCSHPPASTAIPGELLEQAEKLLTISYPPGTRVIGKATFRGRTQKQQEPDNDN